MTYENVAAGAATEMNMNDNLIFVHEKTLSDGSSVFDVTIGGIVLDAVSEDDAIDLADTIYKAIKKHTNTDPGKIEYV